jgi:hypothetical protein
MTNVRAQIGTPIPPPRLLNSNGASDTFADDSPWVHYDPSRRLLVAYRTTDPVDGDSDIYFTKSRDFGATWTPAVPAVGNFSIDASDERDPVLVSNVGSILLYASDRNQVAGEHDIAWGATSGEPSLFSFNGSVNSDATGDPGDDRLPCAASGANAVVCIWQRTIGTDVDLCLSRKPHAGSLWSAVEFLDPSHALVVGQDRHPRVATDGSGKWVAVWDSTKALDGSADGDPDILFSRSTNDGQSWSSPALLNSTATTDGNDADLFPVVAADPTTGNFVVAWISNHSLGGTIGTDNDILWSHSTDGGASWSPAAALNTDAGTDHLGTESNDTFPDLAGDDRGHFVAVWQHGDFPQTEADIRGARLDGLGTTWTDPIPVNTNGATDSGADFQPRIAGDDRGHWGVAWPSLDDLGGTVGTDFDLFVTRFQIPTSTTPGTAFCVGFREDGISRCPCGNDAPASVQSRGCANSTGEGAGCTLTGIASLSGSTAHANGFAMPPNSSALYFQGSAVVNFGEGATFGDGLRCVGGAIVRIGTVTNTGSGGSSHALPTAGLAAGDTRVYQVWYRNAADFCTSSTFNLSAAFAATWLP